MKRFLALLYGISFFAITALVYAQTGTGNTVPVNIEPPASGIDPTTSVGTILSNALTIIFVAAALVVLFMLIFGAFQWITSGGDKDAVGNARKRIVNALIGLAILALSWLIVQVVGQIVNIRILDINALPTLDKKCGPNQTFDTTKGECVSSVRK